MFTHRLAAASAKSRSPALLNQASAAVAVLILSVALLAGCTAGRSAPAASADPSNPDAPVRAVRYAPVLSGYESQRPVSPKPWREQNERVTPRGDAQ